MTLPRPERALTYEELEVRLVGLSADVSRLTAELASCRKERDEVYAVNAAANFDRANVAEDALKDIVALCEPGRIPLPLLNSKVIRRAQVALPAGSGVVGVGEAGS